MAYSPKSRRELLQATPAGQITLVNHGEQVTPPVPNRGMASIAAGVDALFGWRFANATLSITQDATFANTGGTAFSTVNLSAPVTATIVLWSPDGVSSVPITLTVMNGDWDVDNVTLVRLPASGTVSVNNVTVAPTLVRFATAALAADWLNGREFNEATRYFPLWINRGTHVDFLNGVVRVPLEGSVTNQLESQYALDETFDDLTDRAYQQDNAVVTESGDATFFATVGEELSWSVDTHLIRYTLPGRRVYEIEIPPGPMAAGQYLAVSIDRGVLEDTTVSVIATLVDDSAISTANESMLLLGYWDGAIWTSRWGVVFSVPSYAVPARFLPLTGQGIGQVGFLSTDFIGRLNKITATSPTGFSTVFTRMLANGSTPETAFTDEASGVEAATVVARRAVACRETTSWGTAWPPVPAKALRVVSVNADAAALESQYVSASVAVYTPDVKYGTTGISMAGILAYHSTAIEGFGVEIASQAARLDDAESAITDLQSRTSDLEDAVSDLDTRLGTAETDIDELQDQNIESIQYSPYQVERVLQAANPTNFGLFPIRTVYTYSSIQSVPAGSNLSTRQSGNVYATATNGQYLYALHIASNTDKLTKHTLGWNSATQLADVTAGFTASGKQKLVATGNRVFLCDNGQIREHDSDTLVSLNVWTGVITFEDAFVCERYLCVVHRNSTELFVSARGGSSSTVNAPVDVHQVPLVNTIDVFAAYVGFGSPLGAFTPSLSDGVAACSHGPYVFVSVTGTFDATGDYGIVTYITRCEEGGITFHGASYYSRASAGATEFRPRASCCDGKNLFIFVINSAADGYILNMPVMFDATAFNSGVYLKIRNDDQPYWLEDFVTSLTAVSMSATEKEVTIAFSTQLISIDRATKEFTVARSFASANIRSFSPYWGGWVLGIAGDSALPANQNTVLRVRPGFEARDVVLSEATELYKSPYNHLFLPRF